MEGVLGIDFFLIFGDLTPFIDTQKLIPIELLSDNEASRYEN